MNMINISDDTTIYLTVTGLISLLIVARIYTHLISGTLSWVMKPRDKEETDWRRVRWVSIVGFPWLIAV